MARWTTEQLEALITEARELGRWRGGSPEQHALSAIADAADWLLAEARGLKAGHKRHLEAAVAAGETSPARLQYLTAMAARGPADEDEDSDLELDLEASVAAAHGARREPAAL